MNFGLTPSEIVSSFSQATSADFAVGNMDGYAVINQEITFQYNKLLTSLPADYLQLLDRVAGEVATVDVSGYFTPALYADTSSIRAYIVDKSWIPCPGQSLETNEMCWQNTYDQVTTTTANISALGNNNYLLIDTFDYKKQNLVLYYDTDEDLITVESLKSILRSMVCCSLGSRLYPVGNSDVWSIVTYYCEDANKWLEYFEKGGMPAEYKKMKLLNKKSGISSIRIARS